MQVIVCVSPALVPWILNVLQTSPVVILCPLVNGAVALVLIST